jgi:hypothetical protein
VKARRVVIAQRRDGTSYVASDGESIRSHDFLSIPGMSESVLWSTRDGDGLVDAPDQALRVRKRLPRGGATVFLMVQFPPDDVFQSPGFDPGRAKAEQTLVSPDLADLFEVGEVGMHTTPTVDYVVVVDGEICSKWGASRVAQSWSKASNISGRHGGGRVSDQRTWVEYGQV